jgi:hypothetical protein
MRNYKALALELYKAKTSPRLWVEIFDLNELVKLWKLCVNNLDTPYDDEVYEALRQLNYFTT